MRKITVKLDEKTAAALDAERQLLGFDAPETYVRWIVEHRGSIDGDRHAVDGGPAVGTRLDDLEARLDELSRALAGTESARTATPERPPGNRGGSDPAPPASSSDRSEPRATEGGENAEKSPVTAERPSRVAGNRPSRTDAGDAECRSSDGEEGIETAEGGSEPAQDGSEQAQAEIEPTNRGSAAVDDDGGLSMHLTPERVARIRDPDVEDDAGVLGNVEMHRFDELAGRLGETRVRRSRDDGAEERETSWTGLSGAGALPGEDIVDLESIDVPGRSEERVGKRRRLAGRAISYLRTNGTAKKGDFVDALYEECPAEYDSPDGWWRCVKGALKQVDVVEGGDGSRIWRYTG
ncbi:hypothetical protein [Halovivax sp.]|uniref:hypothetical protein n=1 Tax=Halovivax sp. TaxID=1935978 RepID=UPI0025BC066C|nr:hypothetical protein [Halovivax sp.]